jgi:hypothetical protein
MKTFPQQSPKKQKNPGIFAVLMGKTQTQRIPPADAPEDKKVVVTKSVTTTRSVEPTIS